MDKEQKLIFGKILGEIYKTQQLIKGEEKPDAITYGLLSGLETVIDKELSNLELVTKEEINKVDEILNSYFDDGEKETAFSGYYTIESQLRDANISRSKAIKILKLFLAEDRYTTLIKKMNSNNSPSECKNFELKNYDW